MPRCRGDAAVFDGAADLRNAAGEQQRAVAALITAGTRTGAATRPRALPRNGVATPL